MKQRTEYYECPCCGYETLHSYAGFEGFTYTTGRMMVRATTMRIKGSAVQTGIIL